MKSRHTTLFNNNFLAKAVEEGKAIKRARAEEEAREIMKNMPQKKSPMDYLKEAIEREKAWGFRDKK